MRLKPLLLPPILLLAVWALAVWWPSTSAMSTADDRLAAALSEQQVLAAEIDTLSLVATQLPSIDASLADIATALPPEPEVEDFLALLSATATTSDVSVTLVTPNEILDGGSNDLDRTVPTGMTAVAMVIEAEGGFTEVMAFIGEMGELPRLVVIDQIGLASIDGDSNSIVVEMGLRIFSGGAAASTLDVDAGVLFGEIDVLEGGGREREETQ